MDTVLYLLAVSILDISLVEHVVYAVSLDDIVVYASVFCAEEHLWLALKTGEVLVGIGIIRYETFPSVARALQGEIYHVFPSLAVVDGLWSPYPICIGEVLLVVLLENNL